MTRKYLLSCPNCGRYSGGKHEKCIGCNEELINMQWLKENINKTIDRLQKADEQVFN
jgi:hypothetical protein